MTAAANDRFVSIAASAGQTVLAYDFKLSRADAMTVIRVRGGAQTKLTYGAGDFTFPSGLGTASGGTLTLAAAAIDGDVYFLVGALPEDRTSDFVGSQAFDVAKINAQLDALTLIAQEHRRDIERSWKSEFGGTSGKVATPALNEYLVGDGAGNLKVGGTAADIAAAQLNAAAAAAALAQVEQVQATINGFFDQIMTALILGNIVAVDPVELTGQTHFDFKAGVTVSPADKEGLYVSVGNVRLPMSAYTIDSDGGGITLIEAFPEGTGELYVIKQSASISLGATGATGLEVLATETKAALVDLLDVPVDDPDELASTDGFATPAVLRSWLYKDPNAIIPAARFGLRPGEDVDNDAAFAAMFEFYDTLDAGIYFSDFASYAAASVESLVALPQVRFPAGKFVYRGGQLTFDDADARGMNLKGAGAHSTMIAIEDDAVELFQYPASGAALKLAFAAEGISFWGGRGIYANRRNGIAVPQGPTRFHHCRFINQKKFVIGSTWDDDPFLAVTQCQFRNDLDDTIGLIIPRIAASLDVQGNTFQGYRYMYKVLGGTGGFQGNWNINDNYHWALDADASVHDAVVWIVPGGSTDYTFGQGIAFRNMRLSNENLLARPRILIADEDSLSGTDEFDRMHKAAPSTGIVRGLIVEGNTINGSGTAETAPNNAPVILSWTAKLSGLHVFDNAVTAWYKAWLGFGAGVALSKDELLSSITIGPNKQIDFGPPIPALDHESAPGPLGPVAPNLRGGETGCRGQIYTPSVPSAQDKRYLALGSINGNGMTVAGGAISKTNNASIFGGTDAALYDFAAAVIGTDYLYYSLTGTGSLIAGDVVCAEFYAGPAPSASMKWLKAHMLVHYGSGETVTFPEVFPLETDVTLRRFKAQLAAPLGVGGYINFIIPATFVALSSKDRFILDRARFYRANQWIDWP